MRAIHPAIAIAFAFAMAVPTMAQTSSAAAFAQLKSLAGEWGAVQDGVRVRETYTVTANGTALLAETRPANESPMITMFTVDGKRLLATHYCSAGNNPIWSQPRLPTCTRAWPSRSIGSPA